MQNAVFTIINNIMTIISHQILKKYAKLKSLKMFIIAQNVCFCFGLCNSAPLYIYPVTFEQKELPDMKRLRAQMDFRMDAKLAKFFQNR